MDNGKTGTDRASDRNFAWGLYEVKYQKKVFVWWK